jgi:hypothetical protein
MSVPSPEVISLQQLQLRLQRLSTTTYAVATQQELHNLLTATITALQNLYPDDLTPPQRIQLLHQLSLLEEEAFSATVELPLAGWQHLHESLLAAIHNTLTNEASSRS